MPIVYLVSGASRGIGFETVKNLAALPDAFIYAGARSPSTATQLADLAKSSTNVKVVQLDAMSVEDNRAVAALIKEERGQVDAVFGNAGIWLSTATIAESNLEDFEGHFRVNVLSPVILFQAMRPIMSEGALFAVNTSAAGQITENIGFPVGSYGVSKAAANFVVARIGYENKDIVAVAIHPGMVDTDMGKSAGSAFGVTSVLDMPGAITPQQSGKGVAEVLQRAYKDKISPRFLNEKGEALPW